ncbi:MAG: N-methyl-L-tryptophan oxidase [Angustibacter sp.]
MEIDTGSIRPTYDVVVVGLGIMGSAALHQLARRGAAVLGVEALGHLNTSGSSHGHTRIYRRAYWEGERYVPLLNRSLDGWGELDDSSHSTITMKTGGLFVGRPDSTLVRGARETARRCAIPHDYLDSAEISRGFPAFHPHEGAVAVYEPDAMVLFADRARSSYLSQAVHGGADVLHEHVVHSIRPTGNGAVAVAGDGWRTSCGSVVIATGGWIGRLLGELIPWVRPMRIPVFEFEVPESSQHDHRPGRCPVFLYERPGGELVYGLSQSRVAGGVALKAGFHNRQLSPVDLDGDRPPPTDAEQRDVWESVRDLLPAVRGTGRGTACVYTMSRDESFLIGRSRELDGVVYASACSGHGFKFAPAIGEVLAQLALDGRTAIDISAFSADRGG